MPAHRPSDREFLRRARLPAGDPDRLTLAGARRIGNPDRRRSALQAVYRAQYLERRAGRPTASARTAVGHAPPGSEQPTATFFAQPVQGGGARILVDVTVSRADVHRVGRYLHAVRELRGGRVSARAFQRRVSGWRPIEVLAPPDLAGAYRFVADAETALALARRAADEGIETWIDSGRARPRPRRRPSPRGGAARRSVAGKAASRRLGTPRRRGRPSGRPGEEGTTDVGGLFEDAFELLGEGGDLLGEAIDELGDEGLA